MNLKNRIRSFSPDLCRKYGVKRLGLFGSVARGEDSAESDIDFFAEFEDPRPETMPDRYFGFIKEAESQYNRPVQLLTPRMIRNPFLKRSIDRDMIVVYE